jgi:AcrR family transcriptional regulator
MVRRKPKRRFRAPEVTRSALLQAAFQVIYRRGFQAASLEDILEEAGVTKGALYHHFVDKSALGYAVVNEVVRDLMLHAWLGPLEDQTDDPLTVLQDTLRKRTANLSTLDVQLGCPLNNLVQEMSSLDEGFRRVTEGVLATWTSGFARALERGQAAATVRRDVDVRRVAAFLVAVIEGAAGVAKGRRSRSLLRSTFETAATFLDSLRPRQPGGR